ncbi:ArsR/SmtB family transcription factor [Roseburia sp. 1XD42-69]|uniref:ArsR/SmtB family transcription factor n=1 Tax=Roseburia sp. 1XD42-69 TaxID=2320088 RepID=UPI0013140D27|nr:metalloregulator ArsR/SmtB family transcription factor [Roseburia sp. 1XD42-69]
MAEYQDSQLYAGLKESNLYILTEFFKMLGNPTHIRILLLLMEQDAHVSDLAEQLGMTQSAVSHQLNLLKSNKLVKRRKDGKMK